MTYTVAPGARVVWCLRRRTADVRCVLLAEAPPCEVVVLQDRDLVLREAFPDAGAALAWAQEYGARLRTQGWHDSPEDCSPPSAA